MTQMGMESCQGYRHHIMSMMIADMTMMIDITMMMSNTCREELEDVATSVFDLMGRTEETELKINQMIDHLFQA